MQRWLAKKRNTLFNVLFVMMEGSESEFREVAWRKTCLLFFIDFFQLLRILTRPSFGWSERTSGLVEKFDVVYVFTLLGSSVVPHYSFFILASVLVTFALIETAYVARIFEKGVVNQMWPVKVLKFLVVVMVTTLFSSLLKWLLIPLSCLSSDQFSFSEEIHGKGTSCNPFRFPEILATVPTIVVALLYISFAFTVTNFNLCVNLLSRAPTASNTGRVEIIFLANKVAATCLALLSRIISPTAVAAVLLLLSITVFWVHSKTLPFHHNPTNILRGGIYGAVLWATLSSLIVSVNDDLSLQWTLIALLPFAFIVGMVWVHRSRKQLLSALERLRGEWEQHERLRRVTALSDTGETKQSETEDDLGSHHMAGSQHKPANPGVARFFDTNAEKRKIFVSGRHALACARTLLYKRRAEDKEFLEHVIDRGLENFRDYQPLQVFRTLTFTMVLERPCARATAGTSDSLPVDLKYLLHCFERKTTQAMAAQNLGKQKGGQISAINLMEFNLGVAKAKAAHAQALQAIKNCWKNVYRISKHSYRAEQLKRLESESKVPAHRFSAPSSSASSNAVTYEEVVAGLDEYWRLCREASHEYRALLFKFPTSVELLFSYAEFLDTVMNDSREADARRAQAQHLCAGDDAEDCEGGAGAGAGAGAGKGGGGGEGSVEGGSRHHTRRMSHDVDSASLASGSEDKRRAAQRCVAGWEHRIMGSESKQLQRLIWRVKMVTLLLVLTATAAFVVSDFVLFKGMSKTEIHRIRSIGELYTSAVAVCHSTRELMLAAFETPQKFARVQLEGHAQVAAFKDKHVVLHSDVDFPEAEEYFNVRHFTMLVPTAGGWKDFRSTLWELGNKFSAGAQLAYAVQDAELRNASYDLRHMSEEKRNIPFVVDNTFRVVVPTLEELKVIYVREMEQIQFFADLLASINASCNAALVFLITVLVLRGLWTVCHQMESKALMCHLMASLPHRTAKRIYDFYRNAGYALQEGEDEDEGRQDLVSLDGDPDLRSPMAKGFSPLRPLSGFGAACRQRLLGGEASPYAGSRPAGDASPLTGSNRGGSGPKHPESEMECEEGGEKPGKWVPSSSKPLRAKALTLRDSGEFPKQERPSPVQVFLPVRSSSANGSVGSAKGSGGKQGPMGGCGPVVLPLTEENLEMQARGLKGEEESWVDVSLQAAAQTGPSAGAGLGKGEASERDVECEMRRDEGGSGGREPEEGSGVGWGREERSSQGGLALSKKMQGEDVAKGEKGGQRAEVAKGKNVSGFVGFRKLEGEDFAQQGSPGPKSTLRRVSLMGSVQDMPALAAQGSCMSLGSSQEGGQGRGHEHERGAAVAEQVRLALKHRRPWSLRTQTWLVMFAVLMALSLVSTILATRDFAHLIDLAPIVKEAGRRLMLVKAGAFFARELVLDDGFSRMSRQELSDVLLYVLEQVRRADQALRLGDPASGIEQGADVRNEFHNTIMYSNSCPWTEPEWAQRTAKSFEPRAEAADTECADPAKPSVGVGGLLSVLMVFENALESVLHRYGLPADVERGAKLMTYSERADRELHVVYDVRLRAERLALLVNDQDVAYALQSFDGYLSDGLTFVLELLDKELDVILADAINLHELLFAMYLAAVVFAFYRLLFRRAIAHSESELLCARALVRKMPLHVLHQHEVDGIAEFFHQDEDEDEGIDQDQDQAQADEL